MERYKILDWYVHQGHQKEFFKLSHDFYLVGADSGIPNWNEKHRSLSRNVNLITEVDARQIDFDIVIIRSPIDKVRYSHFIDRGAIPISVIQTTNAYTLPKQCKHVVWNSLDVMNRYSKTIPDKNHHYIVHGYDPNEFAVLDLEKNNRVLTVANAFKRRSQIMGYDLWIYMLRNLKVLDVVGHKNFDISLYISEAETFEELIKIYNTYSIYFNPTKSSAMPRSRAEAAMCGMPLVSTDNFDIGMYFTHDKNAILSNDRKVLKEGISKLLESKEMQKEYGGLSREIAIQHFNIKDYLDKWNYVLEKC